MPTHHLNRIFAPQSIAVVGASDRPDSVGYSVLKNLTDAGFDGSLFPVSDRSEGVVYFKRELAPVADH